MYILTVGVASLFREGFIHFQIFFILVHLVQIVKVRKHKLCIQFFRKHSLINLDILKYYISLLGEH